MSVIYVEIIIIIVILGIYVIFEAYYRSFLAEKRLFSSIVSILKTSDNVNIFISRTKLVFEKYIQKNSFAKKEYTSLQDVIESIIYYSEMKQNKKLLERFFGIVMTDEEKGKIYEFYNVIKTDFFYDTLGANDRELVRNLNNAIESSDKKIGKDMINKLVEELHTKDKIIYGQGKRNIIAIAVTVFFGVLTIILKI